MLYLTYFVGVIFGEEDSLENNSWTWVPTIAITVFEVRAPAGACMHCLETEACMT
jgi:hypothetical protein